MRANFSYVEMLAIGREGEIEVGACSSQSKSRTCLILGPHSYLLEAVALILRGNDFDVIRSGSFAVALMASRECHLLIADVDRNPVVLECVQLLRTRGYRGPIVLFATRPGSVDLPVRRQMGVSAVLRKPFRLGELKQALHVAEMEVQERRREELSAE